MSETATRYPRKAAVIGAGASGLTAAKHLLEEGHDVSVFEIGTRIGGLWAYDNDSGRSSAYRSLHINTWRENARFHDFPFDASVQTYPSLEEMEDYFNKYADNFGIRERIRFRSEVTDVEPVPGEGGVAWKLTTVNGDSEVFDAVVAAGGHLTRPSIPDIATQFAGEVVHSHYYRVPAPYADKRVLVVGTGNTACDIAADICVVTRETVISARSPELITPKFFFGRPLAWYENVVNRRWLPRAAILAVRLVVTRLVHGRMEESGFKTPRGFRRATHPISHATLINHIRYRRARVHPGIRDIQDHRVTFVDGHSEEFDTIIFCTGYEMEFPYLAEQLRPVKIEGGDLPLFLRIVSPKWPGLYFVGYFNANALSNIRIYEFQARWLSRLESLRHVLPSHEEMLAEIEARKSRRRKRYPATPRYDFELDPGHYVSSLARQERNGQRRANALRDAVGQLPSHVVAQRSEHLRYAVEAEHAERRS